MNRNKNVVIRDILLLEIFSKKKSRQVEKITFVSYFFYIKKCFHFISIKAFVKKFFKHDSKFLKSKSKESFCL